jgi:esterase/lipase superfamily enzyme
MGFKIVVIDRDSDNEVVRKTVHEVEDRRVTKVHVLTRSGEAATIGIDPDQTDIALEFEYAAAGQLNVVDLDKLKPGYEQNLTGEEVEAREERLAEIRGKSNDGSYTFTQEAADEAKAAEEAAAEAAETEEDRQATEPEPEDEYEPNFSGVGSTT